MNPTFIRKHIDEDSSLRFLDEYATEVRRELHDMQRDLERELTSVREKYEWHMSQARRFDDPEVDSDKVPNDDSLRVRQCVRELQPILHGEKLRGGDAWRAHGALVYNSSSDNYDGAWVMLFFFVV